MDYTSDIMVSVVVTVYMHRNIYRQVLKWRQSSCHVIIFIKAKILNKRFVQLIRLTQQKQNFLLHIVRNLSVMNLEEVIFFLTWVMYSDHLLSWEMSRYHSYEHLFKSCANINYIISFLIAASIYQANKVITFSKGPIRYQIEKVYNTILSLSK